MPRIPDFTALGQAPEPRATRPLYDVSAAGTGMGRAAATVQADADKTGTGFVDLSKGLGSIGTELAEAQNRLSARRDSLESMRVSREFKEELTKKQIEMDTYGNWRDSEGRVNEFRQFADETKEKMRNSYGGSELGAYSLRKDLESIHATYGDAIARRAHEMGLRLANDEYSIKVGENVNTIYKTIGNKTSLAEQMLDFEKWMQTHRGSFTEDQWIRNYAMGRESIFEAALNVSPVEKVSELLLTGPGIRNWLGPDAMARQYRRVTAAEGKGPEDLVEVYDPTSPTKSRMVPKSQAAGLPGREREPLVSLQTTAESAERVELGKLSAKSFEKIQEAGGRASDTIASLDTMKAALSTGLFTTGAFGETRAMLARVANLLGVEGSKLPSLIGDAATADVLDTVSKTLAVEAAPALSRVTNMSLTFIRESLPNLLRTPAGNAVLIDLMRSKAERDVAIAELAEDFMAEHKTARPEKGPSLNKIIRDYEKDNPIVTDELRKRMVEASKQAPSSFAEIFPEAAKAAQKALGAKKVDLPKLTTQEEVDALPEGASFIWTDGESYQKPKK